MHKTLSLVLAFAFMLSTPAYALAASSSAAEAAFTSTLSTKDTTPHIAGKASGTKTLTIEVRDEDGKKIVTKKNVRVKKDRWSTTITKKLKEGEYTVSLFAGSKKSSELASSTLTILGKKTSSTKGGTLSVSQLPLLMGGTAIPGQAAPVAYVLIKNTGKTAASIEGITLVETGSAPDAAVVGFTTNDDKGGSRATSTVMFDKKGLATVPLSAEIAAGQIRIFTVKALISPNKILYGNKELRINVADVDSSAKISGAFPLIGTVFVLR